ncbi:hypothetical protein GF367_04405 [Candidatus Woesearchaeota archaeon]|nr:hypothetical protein [Candidatus Woesearchaeota archaeon]
MAEILSKETQPLLGRTLIQARISFEGTTPDRMKVREDVAKAAGVPAKQLLVRTINTIYGKQEATVTGAVYENMDDAKAVEHKSLIAKHEKKEAPKEEERSSEAAKEGAPEGKPAAEKAAQEDTKEKKPAEDAKKAASDAEKQES